MKRIKIIFTAIKMLPPNAKQVQRLYHKT